MVICLYVDAIVCNKQHDLFCVCASTYIVYWHEARLSGHRYEVLPPGDSWELILTPAEKNEQHTKNTYIVDIGLGVVAFIK